MIIKLTQDKVVKHSVRYALPKDSTMTMSVYIPKELVMRMQIENPGEPTVNGFIKDVWMNMSAKEIK